MKRQKLTILALGSLLVACTSPESALRSQPYHSEYFTTLDDRIISIDNELKYAITLKVDRPPNGSKPWFAVMDFENPANPSSHLFSSELVSAQGTEILILSPKLTAVKNNKSYSVLCSAYADPDRKQLITQHPILVHVAFFDPLMAMHITDGKMRTMGHPVGN